MKHLKILILVWSIFLTSNSFAITKIDEATTNNPSKSSIDFLKGIDFKNTDGILLPSGDTAQRPVSPREGAIRYNNETSSFEGYVAGEWGSIGSGSGISQWQPSTDYKKDDVVFNTNKIYYANADFTSGPTFNPSDWTELSPMDVSNLVDRTTNQTIGGDKTFVNDVNVNGITSLNSSLNGPLKATGGVVNSGKINAASEVTGVLPIANGGTGTSIKNFVDLVSSQSVGGNKSFQNGVAVQGDLLTYGAVQTTLNEGMVSTDAAGKLIKGVLRPEIDLENQRLGFNYGGNDNLIPNGSFENTVAEDNWNCSSGVGTVGESNVSVADGVKSLKVGLGTGASYCYQDNIVIPSANVGKEHIYSITASSDRMLDFCAVGSSLDQNCVRYTPGNGPQLLTTFYTPTTTTGNGLIIKSVNLLAGDMYIDKASMKVVTPSESSKSISNLNSLTDPSFEKGLVDGWQLSGVGSLTASATEVLDLPRNKKALMVDSSTTTNVLTANWSTAIPPAGVSGVCSGWVKTPNDLTVEVVSNSTRIAFKAIEGTNVWQYFEMYFKTDGTHTPTCRFLNATATIYHLDEMFFGLKESPINITSFKNDSSWKEVETSLLAAGNWVEGSTTNPSYGTVAINKMFYQRDGSNLKVRYFFRQTTGGTSGSGEYNFNIKKVFGVNIDTSKVVASNVVKITDWNTNIDPAWFGTPVGVATRGGSAINGPFGGVYVKDSDRLKATFSAMYTDNTSRLGVINSTNIPFNEALTTSLEFSIPIAEWSENTNGALVTCKEGPVKCANEYSASITTGSGLVENEDVDWITSCTAANPTVCTLREPTVNPLTCTFGGNITVGAVIRLVSRTTTTLTLGSYNSGSGATLNTPFDIKCTKQGSDYNAGYEKVVLPRTDVVGVYTKQSVMRTQNIVGAIADLDDGNVVNFTAPASTAITLNNAIDGGVYNIFMTDGIARVYTFTIKKKEDATNLTVRCSPVIATTTASKHANFVFTRIGNNAYCSWAGDL